MEPPVLGLILDSSVIIAAERKGQTVEELLTLIRQTFGEIEVAISAVTVAELAHGVVRANTPEIRLRRRAFIDELKKHVPARSPKARARSRANSAGSRRSKASRCRPTTC